MPVIDHPTTMPAMSSKPIQIAVAGAAGRMGQRLVALTAERPTLTLVGAFDQPNHSAMGTDSGQLAGAGANQVALTRDPPAEADVLIDFTLPQATAAIAAHCAATGTGEFAGANSECSDTLCLIIEVCGSPDSGDCWDGNGSPGCEDGECCAAVCEVDPFCCLTEWDSSCAAISHSQSLKTSV